MDLAKEEVSDQEKHDAAVEALNKLKAKLHSDDISTARRAAHNLSWMQEDGFTILKETLFGNFPRTAKKAAAYGLRSMNGRMKKIASDLLEEGLKNRNRTTKAACEKALFLMKGGVPEKAKSGRSHRSGKPSIQGIRNRTRKNTQWNRASSNK